MDGGLLSIENDDWMSVFGQAVWSSGRQLLAVSLRVHSDTVGSESRFGLCCCDVGHAVVSASKQAVKTITIGLGESFTNQISRILLFL